jgi:NagD protein
VFVAHVDDVDLAALERAARAVSRGAPLLTGNYGRGYWGANGLVFSRGAMVTAAIAKVTGARPVVVGKPSKAAVRELSDHLGERPEDLAVIGDDLAMDIGLGRLGGSRTILVRSGTSGEVDIARVPEKRRPDAVVDGVEELLGWL